MSNRKALATTALAVSAAVAFAPLATAQQQEPKLQLPSSASPSYSIVASTGPCKTFSTVTSPGFVEPNSLHEVPGDPSRLSGAGTTVAKLGTYTASVQCDDKTLTTTFTVALMEVVWSLGPAEIEPGGTIYAQGKLYDAGGCYPEPLTSPGFAEPMLIRGGNLGRLTGSTTVTTTPGTYEVVWQCRDRVERGVKTFRVLGEPPTATTPPPPGAPQPKPKPKPPIVKPKGAPDTGGGGTA